MPMHRWAISFTQAKGVRFDEFSIGEAAVFPGGTLPLKTMNDWPPPGGGAVFITPEYGPLRAVQNVTLIPLTPQGATTPFGTYTAGDFADNTQAQPAGYYLGIGPNAYGSIRLAERRRYVRLASPARRHSTTSSRRSAAVRCW